MKAKMFQDNKGNTSSMRVVFFMFVISLVAMLGVVLVALLRESAKADADYMGLAAVVTALMAGGFGAFVQKALQKKYEIFDNKEEEQAPNVKDFGKEINMDDSVDDGIYSRVPGFKCKKQKQ